MAEIKSTPVRVYLKKGAHFEAHGWGDFSTPRSGEFVFCTAMTGIEESLTDPSFAGQILVTTVSHVGNTGYNGEDSESERIWTEGLVCRHLESQPSNWRSRTSLMDWIVSHGRFVLEGVNTRELTTLLREQGSQTGIVVDASKDMGPEAARAYIETKVPSMEGLDLTTQVTCLRPYTIRNMESSTGKNLGGYWPLGESFPALGKNESSKREAPQIAVWDFGVKRNTLRILSTLGADVHVLPAKAKADELMQAGRSGILLSNGPGDPAAATHIIEELKKVLGRRTVFAICLGHQLVAHAVGAKTYKMKFGHRGIHHPVVELDETGTPRRTWITSQNHGFAVDRDTLPEHVRVSFEHGDDGTVEGLDLPHLSCKTVQFHPEAGPGPTDSSGLINGFVGGLGPR